MKVAVLGLEDLVDTLRKGPQKWAKGVTTRAIKKGAEIVREAISNAVPFAKTEGHSTERVRQSIGYRMVRDRKSGVATAKVGVGVGKKKGTYPTHAVFLATGTVARYTGSKRIRSKKRIAATGQTRESTGNKVAFRGYVKKSRFVLFGFRRSSAAAREAIRKYIEASIKRGGNLAAKSFKEYLNKH